MTLRVQRDVAGVGEGVKYLLDVKSLQEFSVAGRTRSTALQQALTTLHVHDYATGVPLLLLVVNRCQGSGRMCRARVLLPFQLLPA